MCLPVIHVFPALVRESLQSHLKHRIAGTVKDEVQDRDFVFLTQVVEQYADHHPRHAAERKTLTMPSK